MATLTVQGAIHQALAEELGRDANVLLFGEGVATQRLDLVQAFGPERIRNTPLAEAVIAGTAAGAAASGLRPVIDLLFAPFLTYAMDALINSAGKLRYLSGGQFSFPLVVMSQTGSGWCVGAQHNHNLEAMFVHAPGLKVVMPFQPADFKGLLKAAIRDDNPVLFFTDLALLQSAGEVPEDPDFVVPLGKAAVLRNGSDVTLVSYAKGAGLCLEAAKTLEQRGVSAEVIDLRSLKPLDHDAILRSLRKTGRLVVVHEANGLCGVGAEISAHVAQHAWQDLRAPILRITGADVPAPSSWVLEQAAVPQADTIVRAASDLVLSMEAA
jgi:acetoin:2,6-dichlorophenolindophenol oxidoreductase subunit beta